VVRGDQRGRTIGFPTANLKCEPVLVPADGVYAVVLRQLEWEHAAAKPLRGVANIGVRPTFGAGRSVEVYLLDFDGDLYDRRVRLGLVARIRPEMRFAGVDALKAQIGEDVERARGLLAALTEDALRWI